MKSVTIIIHRLGVGGAEQIVVSEAREFLRRGFAVRLITLNPEREQSLIQSLPAGCEREMISFRSSLDWRALRTLARRLKEIKSDIIITQLWFANSVGRIAARMAGQQDRLLAFEQNVYDQSKSWKQFLLDNLLQGWCRKLVAITQSVRESLMRHGIAAERIVVIHNAINIERFTKADSAPIRQELGIGDEFIYLFVGRLVRQKAVDVLLEAFARQASGILLLAGQGEDREKLKARAASLGITSRALFLGVRYDIPALMKAADCFVLASRWEGFGIVLAEAMACGIPIVATTVDGIKEVVDDGTSGILVPPEDPKAFASAMEKIREDRGLARSMGENGARRAADNFSIQKHVDDVLACF